MVLYLSFFLNLLFYRYWINGENFSLYVPPYQNFENFKLGCPFDHYLQVIDIFPSIFRPYFENNFKFSYFHQKCPHSTRLLLFIKSICNLKQKCIIFKSLLNEYLKLCPFVSLNLEYKCIIGNSTFSKVEEDEIWAFYCLKNNTVLKISQVQLVDKYLSELSIKRKLCEQIIEFIEEFKKICDLKTHCAVHRDLFKVLDGKCKALFLKVKFFCIEKESWNQDIYEISFGKLKNEEKEWKKKFLKCGNGRKISKINLFSLNKNFEFFSSDLRCPTLKNLLVMSWKNCLNKEFCQLKRKIIKKINEECDGVYNILISFECRMDRKDLIIDVSCGEDEEIEVKGLVKGNLEELRINEGLLNEMQRVKSRCQGKRKCQVHSWELRNIKNYSKMEKIKIKIEMGCEKTVYKNNKFFYEEFWSVKICEESNRPVKRNFSDFKKCSMINIIGEKGLLVENLGIWKGREVSKIEESSQIGEEKNYKMISLEKSYLSMVTQSNIRGKKEKINSFCLESQCNFYLLKLPFENKFNKMKYFQTFQKNKSFKIIMNKKTKNTIKKQKLLGGLLDESLGLRIKKSLHSEQKKKEKYLRLSNKNFVKVSYMFTVLMVFLIGCLSLLFYSFVKQKCCFTSYQKDPEVIVIPEKTLEIEDRNNSSLINENNFGSYNIEILGKEEEQKNKKGNKYLKENPYIFEKNFKESSIKKNINLNSGNPEKPNNLETQELKEIRKRNEITNCEEFEDVCDNDKIELLASKKLSTNKLVINEKQVARNTKFSCSNSAQLNSNGNIFINKISTFEKYPNQPNLLSNKIKSSSLPIGHFATSENALKKLKEIKMKLEKKNNKNNLKKNEDELNKKSNNFLSVKPVYQHFYEYSNNNDENTPLIEK